MAYVTGWTWRFLSLKLLPATRIASTQFGFPEETREVAVTSLTGTSLALACRRVPHRRARLRKVVGTLEPLFSGDMFVSVDFITLE